jgi:hypothetical protein
MLRSTHVRRVGYQVARSRWKREREERIGSQALNTCVSLAVRNREERVASQRDLEERQGAPLAASKREER